MFQCFNFDTTTCREYDDEVGIIAIIEDPVVMSKILAHLGEKTASVATGMMPQCRAPPPTGLFV